MKIFLMKVSLIARKKSIQLRERVDKMIGKEVEMETWRESMEEIMIQIMMFQSTQGSNQLRLKN
jgi:hypothetical protein